MCGIVGFTGVRNAAPILIDGLEKLEYRGYDSSGVAVVGTQGIQAVKASGSIKNLIEKTEHGKVLKGDSGIGHTRWATHGAPTDVNAHPHVSLHKKFAVVHNGIIENYAALRDELKENGYSFQSDTDTEIIAHLLEYYDTGDFKETVMKTTERLEGSYSLGIVSADHPGTLFAVRSREIAKNI